MKIKTAIFFFCITLFTFCINNYASPSFVEKYYLNGLFQGFRFIYHYTIAHLPFAFVYILLPLLLFIIWKIGKSIVNHIRLKHYINTFALTITSLAVLYNLFYFSWAFNYHTRPIGQRLELKPVQLDTTLIADELIWVNDSLTKIRSRLGPDSITLPITLRPQDLENQIRLSQQQLMTKWGYKANKHIRVRPLYPKGTLLIWSTAGIYNPFSFEGHYDPGLLHLQSTYVIAHEMAHGYGVTNEADCNFIALLTCIHTSNDYIHYSGLLTYWRYLMNDLKEKAKYSFYKAAFHRPIGVRKDIKAMYEELDKYPDVLPNVRDLIYDHYLKSNGVSDGLKSYNKVIDLVFSYRMKEGIDIHFIK